jgi:ribosomal protein L6P/L9E
MPYRKGICFLFVGNKIFSMFVWYFMVMHNYVSRIFYFRLKLRGLGYRIKKIARFFFRFFFARNHFYYFHLPAGVYIKQRFRTLFIVSSNKARLNDLFNQLLILRKMDMYEKTNSFVVKNKIFFLKKRK